MAAKDPTFKSLTEFHARDIAYFSLIDRDDTQVLHSNPELIGGRLEDRRFMEVFGNEGISERRVQLATGEVVYEFDEQLHLPGLRQK